MEAISRCEGCGRRIVETEQPGESERFARWLTLPAGEYLCDDCEQGEELAPVEYRGRVIA